MEANGGRSEHQAKRVADAELRALVKQLGAYVQNVSAGDKDIILSSGFAVVKKGSPVGELPPPKSLGAKLTNMTGRVALQWEREYGADMHHVYMSTTNDPLEWELIGVTTKSRFDADTLKPGTFYWFAVTAIGAAGESSKSDVLRAMAAA